MSDIKGLVNTHTGREVQYLAPPGYIYNLQISNNILNPNTQIDIAAGYAKSDDYEGDILLPAPTTLDLTTDIDIGGAPALSKWYYPWLASDRDGNIVGKISESYTTPVLPAGYIYKRRVGSFYNDAAGNIRPFIAVGNEIRVFSINDSQIGWYTNVAYQILDYSVYAPPTAKFITLYTYAELYTSIRFYPSGMAATDWWSVNTGTILGNFPVINFDTRLYHRRNAGSGGYMVGVSGYTEDL